MSGSLSKRTICIWSTSPGVPRVTEGRFNRVVRDVETVHRDRYERWGTRIRALTRNEAESALHRVPPFSQCRSCGVSKGVRTRDFCKRHRAFAEAVVEAFWGRAKPWDRVGECPRCGGVIFDMVTGNGDLRPSVDHIKPISLGGLEWDRDNLRWMCLKCNVGRGNRIPVPPGKQTKLEAPA